MNLSGFSFVHNGLQGGYPFVEVLKTLSYYCDEVVVVDAGSTDGTREVLERIARVRVLDDVWDCNGGATLKRLFDRHRECKGDIIVHAQADEVWDARLLGHCLDLVTRGYHDIKVHRIQVTQNFQRVRWYPYPVHRIWPKGTVVGTFDAMTTDRDSDAIVVGPEHGLLWDCTNCFRDHWLHRVNAQAELYGGPLNLLFEPAHVNQPNVLKDGDEIEQFLAQPHWTWTRSPFDLPPILQPLVGKVGYDAIV